MVTTIFNLIVLATGCIGLYIAYRLYKEKHHSDSQQMVCPLNFDCADVVFSKYGTFLSFSNEILGALYYVVIILSYVVLLILGDKSPDLLVLAIVGASFFGFLYSFYLIIIQIFTLKEYCSWCLFSAACNFVIIFSSWFAHGEKFFLALSKNLGFLFLLFIIGFVIAILTSIMSSIYSLKLIRKNKISDHEDNLFLYLSQSEWIGLSFLIMSYFGLYILAPEFAVKTSTYLISLIVLFAIIIIYFVLNLIAMPKMIEIKNNGQLKKKSLNKNSYLLMVTISVFMMIFSWIWLFMVVWIMRNQEFPFEIFLGEYLFILVIGVITGILYYNSIKPSQIDKSNA